MGELGGEVDRKGGVIMSFEDYLSCHTYCEWPRMSKTVVERHVYNCVSCESCGGGWSVPIGHPLPIEAVKSLCGPCDCGGFYEDDERESTTRIHLCAATGCIEEGEERYSMGLTAGYWCDRHYNSPEYPYRKPPDDAYDWFDAGEYYDDDY